MLVLGAVTMFSADSQKHPVLVKTFMVIFPLPFIALFENGAFIPGYVKPGNLFYSFVYVTYTNLSMTVLFPYFYWSLYSILLLLIVLDVVRDAYSVLLITAAPLATLVVMWVSPTMYLSGNRTCALFTLGLICIFYRVIIARKRNFIPLLAGAGACNMLCLTILLYITKTSRPFDQKGPLNQRQISPALPK